MKCWVLIKTQYVHNSAKKQIIAVFKQEEKAQIELDILKSKNTFDELNIIETELID